MRKTAEEGRLNGFSRGTTLAACIVAMLAVANLQYAWTLFTGPLEHTLSASLAAVQWSFTFFVITQTGLLPFNGYLIDRFGARLIISIAGPLVGLSWVVAGLANSLPVLYVAYAAGGIGVGAVYGACVGLAMKWFPERRGLCVGLVAGSYGFGTAITVLPISHMIAATGYRSAFITWGIIQGMVVLVAAQFLETPLAGWAPAGFESIKARMQGKVQQSSRDYTPREMLRARPFYLMYCMMSIVAFSGLLVTAQLGPIARSFGFDNQILFRGVTVLGFTMLLNGVLNGATRPLFGWISDHIGRYDTMGLAFILEGIAITGLTFVVDSPIWFVVLTGLTFFAWGEIYSLFPSAIADVFGGKYATTNFGIQYTSKGVASILAAPVAATIMTATGSWLPVLWAAVACNLVAAVLALFWLKKLVTRQIAQQGPLPVVKVEIPAVSESPARQPVFEPEVIGEEAPLIAAVAGKES